MNYLSIATLIVTAWYLGHIGIIPSISDSYRTIKDKRIYHGFFIVSAFLIGFQGATTEERLIIPYVIAGFFFFCIALAAAFWKPDEKVLHVVFTYAAISAGLTLTILRIWPVWGFKTLGLVVLMVIIALLGPVVVKKNATYWQEVAAYLIIFIPIL
jgi:hypothetical protein